MASPWMKIGASLPGHAGSSFRGKLAEDAAKQKAKALGILADDARNSAQQVGPSQLQSVKADPRFIESQMGALKSLEERAASADLTPQERLQLAQTKQQVGQFNRGNQDAILQQARMRGMSNSGQTMQAQLAAAQAAAERASMEGMQTAASASQRQQDAILSQAGLAGQMREQGFTEAANRAAAEDAIAKFNASARERAFDRYTAAQMAAISGNAQAAQEFIRQAEAADAEAKQAAGTIMSFYTGGAGAAAGAAAKGKR